MSDATAVPDAGGAAASPRPLIGVPAMWSKNANGLRYSASVVANAVLAAIVRAGGSPVAVYPDAPFDYSRVDGIVLPGGSDIAPARYGQTPIGDEVKVTDFPGQDDADARAIAAAEELGLPTLLICRGMQLWNVERGGTMHQHWESDSAEAQRTGHVGEVHDVALEPGSALAGVFDGAATVDVSSYHHQAVAELGRGLRVVARAHDGCVEALEDPSRDIIAVQWHPEDRADSVATDQRLFDWVVDRARARAASRGAATTDRGATPAVESTHG